MSWGIEVAGVADESAEGKECRPGPPWQRLRAREPSPARRAVAHPFLLLRPGTKAYDRLDQTNNYTNSTKQPQRRACMEATLFPSDIPAAMALCRVGLHPSTQRVE